MHTVTATSRKISGTATLAVTPGPDLAASQTVSTASPYYYAPVTFTTTITNTSTTTTSTGVTATVNEPAGLVSPAATASTGSYTSGTWTIGSLAPGATATLTITGDAGDVSDGTQTVTATVSSTTIDPNPANNTASASEASQPAPYMSVITPDPNNLNPVDVCAPLTTLTWYGSAVNAINAAAPPPAPAPFFYNWTCETTSPQGCPTPNGDPYHASFISYDNTAFEVGATYVFIPEIQSNPAINPNYQSATSGSAQRVHHHLRPVARGGVPLARPGAPGTGRGHAVRSGATRVAAGGDRWHDAFTRVYRVVVADLQDEARHRLPAE